MATLLCGMATSGTCLPQLEAVWGAVLPNVTLLHWAQQKYALVDCDGRLVGQGLHHQSYHTQMHTTQHQRIFSLRFVSFPCFMY